MPSFNRRGFTAAAAAVLALPRGLRAQTWPSKPVRIVVAYAAGGSIDALGRRIAKQLEGMLNVPVVVENLSGAGGRIGTQAVARSPGDGYTLMVTSSAAHGVAPGLYSRSELGYDPLAHFSHIGLISSGPMALIVKSDSPYRNLRELVGSLRSKNEPLFYGSAGIGSLGHLTGAVIGQTLGIRVQHVSYRGSVPALQDMLAGNLMSISDNLSTHMQHYRNGAVRILGVASVQRFSGLPEVPTFAEQGYPEVIANGWYGFSGSAGISDEIVSRLNLALEKIVKQPEMHQTIVDMATNPEGQMSPLEYTNFVKSEVAKWSQVIKAARISVT